MHALLERLSPAERTSFMLHDVFQYPFEEVATIVGRSPASCRQLASRARRTLQAESAPGRFSRGLRPASAAQRAVHRRLHRAGTWTAAGVARSGRRGCVATSVPAWWSGQLEVAPGILRYLGPPASPKLMHLPVGDRIGIVAMRDRRVLALVVLKIGNGLIVHVDALAGEGPRAAVSAALGLR